MNYRVRFTRRATEDLHRLYDFVLDRELRRGGDLDLAERAIDAIENAIATLRFSPFTCRKAGQDPLVRELVIPFGHTGYVALFSIDGPEWVSIAAVRHQREDDYC